MPAKMINLIFGIAYVVCFLGAMGIITKGHLDMAALASAPIVLGAETIVFAMMYATIVFDGHEQEGGGDDHVVH